MNWQNVKLILGREVRDQLRDRRTLFMIAVLPLLLYPLLGMSFLQVSQFLKQHPTRVLIVGGDELVHRDAPPRLFNQSGNRFDPALFGRTEEVDLLELTFADRKKLLPQSERSIGDETGNSELLADAARSRMREQQFDAVIYFPPNFVTELQEFRAELKDRGDGRRGANPAPRAPEPDDNAGLVVTAREAKPRIPSPVIFYNTGREASQVARARIESVLYGWTGKVGEQNLIDSDVPTTAARPFSLQSNDVAEAGRRDAVTWAKILPFVLMIWALTGAFYPAVDLCAGEKERGTLETLLCSPAGRSEIVVGKLMTVMAFSMATAVLNLASMGITGAIVIGNLPQLGQAMSIGMPPVSAIAWLALALPPVSAFFGALAVALAAFARSTKEGQYYLMPLILVTMPLMILPMQPSMELTLGTSLIPVTGLMLLLRELLMSNYVAAATYAAPVIAVTLTGCFFAVRWAIDQFNSESVLFRESERLDLGLWLKHLMADRRATPTVAMAVTCGVLILVIRFFMNFALRPPETATGLLVFQAITLLAIVATPALIMTVVLTRSPRETLLLKLPRGSAVAAAVALALAVHPLALVMQRLLAWLYPVDTRGLSGLTDLLSSTPYVWLALVFAVLPALCEEVAFRGFILSGLRDSGHPWRAVVLSSIFFGIAHSIVQQSIAAAILGMVLGYLAIRSGSLLCPIVFHAVHNGLIFALSKVTPEMMAEYKLSDWLVNPTSDGSYMYQIPVVAFAAVAAVAAMIWFRKATPQPSTQTELTATIAPAEIKSLLEDVPAEREHAAT